MLVRLTFTYIYMYYHCTTLDTTHSKEWEENSYSPHSWVSYNTLSAFSNTFTLMPEFSSSPRSFYQSSQRGPAERSCKAKTQAQDTPGRSLHNEQWKFLIFPNESYPLFRAKLNKFILPWPPSFASEGNLHKRLQRNNSEIVSLKFILQDHV